MLIHRIEINNFRQYYDRNIIDLSCDREKNVTVIRGENGVGKTAMLNALKWAFFNEFTTNFRNKKSLVNNTAKKNGTNTCWVRVTFEEDERVFVLTRRYDERTSKSDLALSEYEGSTLGSSLPEPDLVISGMLPREMGAYFFFQGEGSNAVTTGSSSGDIAQSIRDIMGFGVANELSNTLRQQLRKVNKSISEQDTSGESQRINTNLERGLKEQASVEEDLDQAQVRLPRLEDDMVHVQEKLSQIQHADLEDLRKREREQKNRVAKCEQILRDLNKRKCQLIQKYGWAVFGYDFATKSLDFIDESSLKGRLPEPYNETFIKDILEEAQCICGAKLEEGSESYKRITALLSKAANPALQSRLGGIRAQISTISTLYESASEEIKRAVSEYESREEELHEAKKAVYELDKRIQGIPEEEIRNLQRAKNNIENDIRQTERSIGSYIDRLERIKKDNDNLQKELESMTSSSDIIDSLKIRRSFVNELREYLISHLEKTEKNIRLHVIKEVNDTLEKFSRHDFKIKVSEEGFRFYLLDREDRPVGQGDGLNLLLNLTITASLIQFAAKYRVNDPILSSATVAPLVIDAPFGVLDSKYRNVVVETLPSYAKQVVFFVSSSQWTDEMDGKIRDKIGKEYLLELEETAEQGKKSVDIINIRGKEHTVSRYGCDIDRTVIREVTE